MAPIAGTSQLLGTVGVNRNGVDTPLPLQVALIWLVVAVYTTNGTRENHIHSSEFIASILSVITGEILEVS
jgi:hypothetical protein